MPNRILKESICSSENIDRLTAFQETVFYRLIVNCDDFGRMDARPKILASKLFPLKDIRINHISEALRALSSAELVTLYEVDGKPFLQMKTWDRHQQIRSQRSKYPSPENGTVISNDINCNQMISNDINCNQMISNVPVIQSNPIQSESESNPNPNRNPTREARGEHFDEFWSAYPRHEAKQAAKKAFDKINPDAELLQTMLAAIERWKQSDQWQENDGQFVPYPASWLNGRRWEDEVPKSKKRSPGNKTLRQVIAQQYEQRDYSDIQREYELQMQRDIDAALGR